MRTLPVDQIKLDRSFAAALDEGDAKQRAVVQSVVSLASVKGQGFLYHQPVLWDAARALLESGGVCAVSSEAGYTGLASSEAPSPSASTNLRSHRPSPSVST